MPVRNFARGRGHPDSARMRMSVSVVVRCTLARLMASTSPARWCCAEWRARRARRNCAARTRCASLPCRSTPRNGTPARLRGQRIVEYIAQVKRGAADRRRRAAAEALRDEASDCFDVVHRHDARKQIAHAKAFERMPQFPPRAAGKQREFGALGPSLQTPRAAPASVRATRCRACRSCPNKSSETARFTSRIFHVVAQRSHPVRRQPPIIVISGAALPLLNIGVSDALAGEMPHGIDNRAVKRTVNVHQHAIHVKDDQLGRKRFS